MADIKFTPSQSAAISHEGANLLVAAAAGSGKTAVVARRAVRLLSDEKVPAGKLLLITFTKAAAAEMRERVSDVLKEKFSKTEDPFLRHQLRALPDADICTIDSYLTRVLRRHYHAVDLDPAFSVISEDEKQNLSQKVIKKITNEAFDKDDADFKFFCDTLAGGNTKNIADLILSAYDYAIKYENYEDFVKSWEKEYTLSEDEIKNSLWIKESLRAARFELSFAEAALEAAVRYAFLPQGPSSYADLLENELNLIKSAQSVQNLDDFIQNISAIDFGRLPRKDKDCDETIAKKAQNLRNDAKSTVKKIGESIIFKPMSDIAQRHRDMAPAIRALSALVLEYAKMLDKEKRRYNVLDFSDLMHYALKALSIEEISNEEKARYDYVFVDEYQDTNRLQEKLIGRITKGDNLFCVGDLKQSIYSFRQAEPSLFIERMDKSSLEFAGRDHLIYLSENFRSSPAVVDFINLVFTDVMTRKTGGVDYTGNELLKCKARRPDEEYDGASAELYVIDASIKNEDSYLSNIEYEAVLAAKKIKEVMSKPIYDGKKDIFRPAKFSDICILSRSFKPIVRPVRRILEQQGIPVTPLGETGYLDMLEIEIALNILKIVDNIHRDVALISAMNSPAFGFNIEELIHIRKSCKKIKAPFHEALKLYANSKIDALSGKIISFLDKIEEFRLLSRHMPLGEFIWHMLTDTMLYDAVGALPGGRVRQQNLRILAERGDVFSQKPGRNLSLFLEHMHSVSKSEIDFEGAADESGDDSVKFMSVHKSKGLEFPVVILINTASSSANNTDTIIMSDGLVPAVKCYDPEEMTKKSTLSYHAATSSKNFTESAESLRILYVALTRAREKLIMIGSVGRSMESRVQSWTLPKKAELIFDKPFLDILASSAVRVYGNLITDETQNTSLNNFKAEIIPATHLEFSKKTRKNAVLDAISEAAAAPYPEDAFSFSYEIKEYVPAKTTATALLSETPTQYEMEDFGEMPDFIENETELTAAQKGTFTHTLMRFIDFNSKSGDIDKSIDDLINRNILPEEAKSHIDKDAVINFLTSSLCERIKNSDTVKKELPFVIKLKANEVFTKSDSDEDILVQGIIDLCFKEDDKWVLVDYKTNIINEKRTPESLVSHYRKQIETYKTALTRLTNITVKEAGIYFLNINNKDAFFLLN